MPVIWPSAPQPLPRLCKGKLVRVTGIRPSHPFLKGDIIRAPGDRPRAVFVEGDLERAPGVRPPPPPAPPLQGVERRLRRSEGGWRVSFARGLTLAAVVLAVAVPARGQEFGPPLPGTKPLTMTGDLASEMVAGADRFLLKQIEESAGKREKYWKRDFSSEEAYQASVEPNRKRLAHILGVRDSRVADGKRQYYAKELLGHGGSLAIHGGYDVRSVTWTAFGDVQGEGLALFPGAGKQAIPGIVVVIPDAGQSPEQLAGLAEGVAPESQLARRLADNGYHVIVPSLIDRTVEARNGRVKLTNREFVYRSAFELGRHLIGYEVQKVLGLIDALKGDGLDRRSRFVIFGYGEGGMIALYAAALDPRIEAVCVSGFFGDRSDIWRQPVDRNVSGLLEQFGDAEVASLIAPRPLVVEASKGPEFLIPPGTGGAPGRLTTPNLEGVKGEVEKARRLVSELKPAATIKLVTSGPDGLGPFGTDEALLGLLSVLSPERNQLTPLTRQQLVVDGTQSIKARQDRQLHELDRHNQQLLVESADVRREFMKKLDISSLEQFNKTVEPYREYFANEVIGRFDQAVLPPNVRTRRVFDEPLFTGYEVVMDVFPDVFAYGILLLPKNIKEGEKRAVVVCQHGLEGRPSFLADPNVENASYHKYAVRLAEKGFITFAPQNLYIFHDRFRTLQRKANPLKKTLFSLIVPQHQQITDWLKSLPYVDAGKIAFYGLSYGGKSAMRIPPLVKNYCLSICSADFNEWVWKNASTKSSYSYVWTPEYEIFEFDLGSTFNYAEMAALIAPRPFMVERGHFDGVSSDEAVAYEFAKVNFLYDAKLGIGDRCAIEFFVGPHTINGKGTFAFLEKHLK
jgi:dienelactone hydrolase